MADNYSGNTGNTGCYPGGGVNEADGSYHTFWWDNLTNATQDAANKSRIDDYEPTDLDTDVAFDSGPSVDVAVHDNDYTDFCGWNWATIAGLVSCAELVSSGQCDKHHAYFDLSDVRAMGDGQRRSLTCHEFGHTVGLKHRNAGCMTDGDHWPIDLTDHDRDHINHNY